MNVNTFMSFWHAENLKPVRANKLNSQKVLIIKRFYAVKYVFAKISNKNNIM